ncbi:hypothetical protein Taro_048808, partial [Colocasia esculenta]|nr:hypothetical protein [Colocasia esculenta]
CVEGCFRSVSDSVGFCGSRFPVFGVPAALAGEGLVIPTRPCSRGSPPLHLSARGSSSRELGVGRVAEVFGSVGGDANFGVPGGVREVGLLQTTNDRCSVVRCVR